jgi:hypothetical protein
VSMSPFDGSGNWIVLSENVTKSMAIVNSFCSCGPARLRDRVFRRLHRGR